MSRLFVERAGDGPPLLLIHGIGDSTHVWDPVRPLLAPHRDVIAIDLPGFGRSGPLPPGMVASAAGHAREVAGLLDDLGLDTVHVAGSSLGAWVALELALLGRARSVCGLSAAGFATDLVQKRQLLMLTGMRAAARAALPHADRLSRSRAFRTVTFAAVVAHPRAIDAATAAEALRFLAGAPGFDATLAHISRDRYRGGDPGVPVTIAWGAKDRLLPPVWRYRVAERLPQARVGLLKGCGHLPTWDDPALVTRVLLAASAEQPA